MPKKIQPRAKKNPKRRKLTRGNITAVGTKPTKKRHRRETTGAIKKPRPGYKSGGTAKSKKKGT